MLYWSQKPYNVTDLILDLFTKEGSTVMDPFMGSGVTLIESLNKKYNLKSIGVDINDVPIFLCKTSLTETLNSTIDELDEIVDKVKKLNECYYTKCPTCGNIIDSYKIEESKAKMLNYATMYKQLDSEKTVLENEYQEKISEKQNEITK